jgi:hypothetical protein
MGAAPMALPQRAPRHAGAGRIMMGIPTQPFRAGLTFSGRPSGPRWDLGRTRPDYFAGFMYGLKPVPTVPPSDMTFSATVKTVPRDFSPRHFPVGDLLICCGDKFLSQVPSPLKPPKGLNGPPRRD